MLWLFVLIVCVVPAGFVIGAWMVLGKGGREASEKKFAEDELLRKAALRRARKELGE